jgi:hypothetical protein
MPPDIAELRIWVQKADHDLQTAEVGFLTPFAVRYRYPGPVDPDVNEIRDARKLVNDFRIFVSGLLPSGIVQ